MKKSIILISIFLAFAGNLFSQLIPEYDNYLLINKLNSDSSKIKSSGIKNIFAYKQYYTFNYVEKFEYNNEGLLLFFCKYYHDIDVLELTKIFYNKNNLINKIGNYSLSDYQNYCITHGNELRLVEEDSLNNLFEYSNYEHNQNKKISKIFRNDTNYTNFYYDDFGNIKKIESFPGLMNYTEKGEFKDSILVLKYNNFYNQDTNLVYSRISVNDYYYHEEIYFFGKDTLNYISSEKKISNIFDIKDQKKSSLYEEFSYLFDIYSFSIFSNYFYKPNKILKKEIITIDRSNYYKESFTTYNYCYYYDENYNLLRKDKYNSGETELLSSEIYKIKYFENINYFCEVHPKLIEEKNDIKTLIDKQISDFHVTKFNNVNYYYKRGQLYKVQEIKGKDTVNLYYKNDSLFCISYTGKQKFTNYKTTYFIDSNKIIYLKSENNEIDTSLNSRELLYEEINNISNNYYKNIEHKLYKVYFMDQLLEPDKIVNYMFKDEDLDKTNIIKISNPNYTYEYFSVNFTGSHHYSLDCTENQFSANQKELINKTNYFFYVEFYLTDGTDSEYWDIKCVKKIAE